MTDEEKFLFDLKGWVLIPGVLEPDLLAALREHVIALRRDPESLPEHERYSPAGPGQELIDHCRTLTSSFSGDEEWNIRS